MKTKIDERREREAYDRENPWQPITSATVDGIVCELLFSDLETSRSVKFFFNDDGHWYRIDPPKKIYSAGWAVGRGPINWRPTNVKLTPARRAEIVHEALVGSRPSW